MTTYKQPIKELSRRLLWDRAVRCVTEDRQNCRVLDEDYIRRLWDYSYNERLLKYNLAPPPNESFLDGWADFANDRYGRRSPKELRVAYLCGPEPENDVKVMLNHGIRVENIWAFERDRGLYQQALHNIKNAHPTLKIVHGRIEDFLQVNPIPFDIIYLDFAGSIISREAKAYSTIHGIFDFQALNELGVLVINSGTPDKTKDTLDFLTDYFLYQPLVEGQVLGCTADDGKAITWFVEGPCLRPLERNRVRNSISENWDASYSAFVSQYPLLYSNIVQPSLRVLRNPLAKQMIFEKKGTAISQSVQRLSSIEALKRLLESEEGDIDILSGGDLLLSPSDYPLWHFILALKESNSPLAKTWYCHYAEAVCRASRFDAIRLGGLLRSAFEGYVDALSEPLRSAIPRIYEALPDKHGGLFCDVPMPRLWLEVALNQLGFPYHPRIDKHWRCQYTSKERKMMVDVFVFDRCRAFYDWLPTIEYYGKDLAVPERQIITRACLDAIEKQTRWPLSGFYSYSSLIGKYEVAWARFAEFDVRKDLNQAE